MRNGDCGSFAALTKLKNQKEHTSAETQSIYWSKWDLLETLVMWT